MKTVEELIEEAALYTDGFTEESASGPTKTLIRLVDALKASVTTEYHDNIVRDAQTRIHELEALVDEASADERCCVGNPNRDNGHHVACKYQPGSAVQS